MLASARRVSFPAVSSRRLYIPGWAPSRVSQLLSFELIRTSFISIQTSFIEGSGASVSRTCSLDLFVLSLLVFLHEKIITEQNNTAIEAIVLNEIVFIKYLLWFG